MATDAYITQQEKFNEAVTQRGRSITIKQENGQQSTYFNPVAGAFPNPLDEIVHTVRVVPFSDEGKAQLASRSNGSFIVDPSYEAFSIEAGTYTPIVGDVLIFEGRPVTVVIVDATIVNGKPVHYQIGIRTG